VQGCRDRGVRGQIILPAISAIFECANCSPRVCPRFWPTCSLCQPNGPSTIVAVPLSTPSHPTPPGQQLASHIWFMADYVYAQFENRLHCLGKGLGWFGPGPTRTMQPLRSSFSYLGGFCVDDVLVTKEQHVSTFCAHYLYTQGCRRSAQ